jgi:hypothetical protein
MIHNNINCFCQKYDDNNVKGIETIIKKIKNEIVQNLNKCLDIKTCGLGVAEKRDVIREGDFYTLPQIKSKNDIDFINIEPSDSFSFFFFIRAGEKTNFNEIFNSYTQNFDIIFWFNSSEYIKATSEELQENIIKILSKSRLHIESLNKISFGVDETWEDFTINKDSILKFNNKNYNTFKINITMNYKFNLCNC